MSINCIYVYMCVYVDMAHLEGHLRGFKFLLFCKFVKIKIMISLCYSSIPSLLHMLFPVYTTLIWLTGCCFSFDCFSGRTMR